MKKSLSILIMVFVMVTLCSGCGSIKQPSEHEPVKKVITNQQSTTLKSSGKVKYLEGNLEDKDSGYNIIYKGNYYLFSTKYLDTYVMFLGELDQSIYEIVDIQIENYAGEAFFVTYKKK